MPINTSIPLKASPSCDIDAKISPNMDTLEASSPADATSRRRSGRTVKQPVLYQEDPNISTPTNGAPKRKRAQHVGTENQNEEDGSGNEDSDDGVPGEEEVAEPKKKPRKAPRAAKKAKTAQPESLTLAIRPAVNGARRPSKPKPKPKKPRAKVTMLGGTEGTGLYGMRFYIQCCVFREPFTLFYEIPFRDLSLLMRIGSSSLYFMEYRSEIFNC